MDKFEQVKAKLKEMKAEYVLEHDEEEERLFEPTNGYAWWSGFFNCLKEISFFVDHLDVKDPYEQCIQYPSIKDGIKAHAETYSFNIESELFNQLTKEQQALWRKEIEQACISGGEMGVELARDIRYKENLEIKSLTWQDIKLISEIGESFMNSDESDNLSEEEYYTEILKRFKTL